MFEKLKNAILGNKATTAAGTLAFVPLLIEILYSLDGNPETSTNWPLVMLSLSAMWGGFLAATGFKKEGK